MSARFLLVDLENVQPAPSDVDAWLTDNGSAWIFHGPHQVKMLPRYSALGERVTLVPISKPGENSLDFHLVFYLGYLTARNPNGKFVVLSKDTGYDPAIAHALMLAFDLLRLETLGSPAASSRRSNAFSQPGIKKRSTQARMAAPEPAVASSKVAAPAKQVAPTKNIATGVAAVPAKVVKRAQIPSGAKSAPSGAARGRSKAVTALYEDVLFRIRQRPLGRPRSREALERHIQTIAGTEPPEKVRAVVDRLFAVAVVRQDGRRIVYFPKDADAPHIARHAP